MSGTIVLKFCIKAANFPGVFDDNNILFKNH